jgi:hypothetical protein
MKYLKVLAIAIVAGVAGLAAVGPSAAAAETVLCTESVSLCPASKADTIGTEIKASLASGTASRMTVSYKESFQCGKASLTAKVTSTGKKIGASLEALTFEECSCEVKVLKKGTLELEHITGTINATVKSSGTEVTTQCSTIFGNVHCIYVTSATDLGTLEGGNPAKLKISAEIPREATNFLCNEESRWEAEYEVTSPKPLYVEPE